MVAQSTSLAAEQKNDLKISRVALFSSGVGYFDCDATVTDAASAELRFRTDQINDVLKSLVVQDFSGGSVGVVSYPSKDPIEKTLKSFGVDITGKPTLANLLDQLRGEPVQIAGPKSLTGIIVGVEEGRMFVDGDKFVKVDLLNLLTDGGVVQLRVHELQGIKLTNEKVDGELRKALATLASSHDADKKSVTLRFDGKGKRDVRASYLVEAPIWKTSYRLVLADNEKPFLQGWAMVENATEEDWKDVRLSLVSGRPISFQMDLYTPLYLPRPWEQLELYASLRPPELAAGAAIALSAESEETVYKIAQRQRGGARKDAAPPPPAPAMARMTFDADFAEERKQISGEGVASLAEAQDAGELFEYVIKTPVSIPRRNSAMLPIVNESVTAEKLSVYNEATHAKYPLNALQLTNSTKLNLMQGPVTLFDGSVYAGDAKLPDLKPEEKRLVAYALDLAMEVTIERKTHPDELVSVKLSKGVLQHIRRQIDTRAYSVKNKDDKDRALIIEQALGGDWTLEEPKETYEKTANTMRFKITVPKQKTALHKVKTQRIYQQSIALLGTNLDDFQVYLTTGVISKEVKAALEKLIAMRTDYDRTARDRAAAENDIKTAREEQARVRENLRTLQSNSDSHARQMKKFDELETQIEKLTVKINELRTAEEAKRRAMEDFAQGLEVE